MGNFIKTFQARPISCPLLSSKSWAGYGNNERTFASWYKRN
nr:MAG TPA: hypothetical protein [Caudoviricetes sp.]